MLYAVLSAWSVFEHSASCSCNCLTLEDLLAKGEVRCHHGCRQQGPCCNNGSEGAGGQLLGDAAALCIAADCLDLHCLALASCPGSDLVVTGWGQQRRRYER